MKTLIKRLRDVDNDLAAEAADRIDYLENELLVIATLPVVRTVSDCLNSVRRLASAARK